jgi:hypothetical protein
MPLLEPPVSEMAGQARPIPRLEGSERIPRNTAVPEAGGLSITQTLVLAVSPYLEEEAAVGEGPSTLPQQSTLRVPAGASVPMIVQQVPSVEVVEPRIPQVPMEPLQRGGLVAVVGRLTPPEQDQPVPLVVLRGEAAGVAVRALPLEVSVGSVGGGK